MSKKKDDTDSDFNTDVFNFLRRIEDGESVHDHDSTHGSDKDRRDSDDETKEGGGERRRE